MRTRYLPAALALAVRLPAAPPASSDYSISSATFNAGGGIASSASYAALTGNGEPGGVTTAPGLTAKPGFSGQLYEVTALEITAPATTILESASAQLGAIVMLDDGSLLLPGPAHMQWGIRTGPIDSISDGGLAAAGQVYQNTPAAVQGSWLGHTDLLELTIRNTGDDDYSGYGGDGISDLWQVGYFGEQSPLGFAAADPDGDGEDNLLEFLTGCLPNDANSLFTVRTVSLNGNSLLLELSRVQSGAGYHIETSTDLVTWKPLLDLAPGFTQEPFAQALPVSEPRAFYRVKVSADP